MKKKTAKKSEAVPDGQLGDWLDQYPDDVIAAADVYDKMHTAHQKTKGKLTTAKENLIAAMREHGVDKCPIRNGEKLVRLTATDVVKIDKPKSDETPEPDGDVFDAAK